ncbi:MAG: OmpA family protein [Ignavibacteriales bacterium]
MRSLVITVITMFMVLLLCPGLSHAQFDILNKVKEKVQQKAEEKTDEAIDKSLEEAEKKATQKDDNEPGEDTKQKKEAADEEADGEKQARNDEKPKVNEAGLKSFSKYDFVPGEKVIFYEDFSQDNVGDFPVRWNTNGSGEVVTINKYPGKWLKAKNGSLYVPDFPKPFPDNYTIEFDMVYNSNNKDNNSIGDINFCLIASDEAKEYLQHTYAYASSGTQCANLTMGIRVEGPSRFLAENYLNGGSAGVSSDLDNNITDGKMGKIVRVSIAVQKQRYRLWIDDRKIYDLPRFVPQGKYDIFKLGLWGFDDQNETYELLLSNFRFAVGAPDMRSKLITEGILVTRGITFDSGSDKIKPESYGTLKEIAAVLKENSDVRVKIVGHTDSDGSDAANLELSRKRSKAVKTVLNSEFGIESSRMETDGKGESVPVSENNTPDGKANNRRVEFIKL